MAVKLTKYYWFRNNYLLRSLEDEICEIQYFGTKLSTDDRKNLKDIVDKLDELKKDSNFQQVDQSMVELKDVTSNPESAATYLSKIHEIMEKYWVKCELYKQLGDCFDEIKLKPSEDIAEAVKYVRDKIKLDQFASLDPMCWKTIKEHKLKGI